MELSEASHPHLDPLLVLQELLLLLQQHDLPLVGLDVVISHLQLAFQRWVWDEATNRVRLQLGDGLATTTRVRVCVCVCVSRAVSISAVMYLAADRRRAK